MIICPDCSQPLKIIDHLICDTCSWEGTKLNKIKNFLSTEDRKDPTILSYTENYDIIAEDDLHSSIQSPRYIQLQAENLAKLINVNPNSSVCDIGIGQGYLLKEVLKKGVKNITAIDIAAAYLKKFEDDSRIDLVLANAENLPFENQFDVITTTDVLEHVLNVGSFLYSVNRALKMDGMLYLRVPYRENLIHYSPFFGCKYKFVHLRTFNKETLRDYMHAGGFEVIKLRLDGFWYTDPQSFWTKNEKREERFKKSMKKLMKNLKNVEEVNKWPNWFAKLLMRPFEIGVVAKKVKNLKQI